MLVAKQYCQIAWVVDDLDKAVQQWQQTARIGPFFMGAHVGAMIGGAVHRGHAVDVDISCAIAQAGPVQIELIKQHGSGPSPYRDVFREGENGLHHICSFVDDVEAECRNYQDHGFEVVMTASVGGLTPVAYIDTRPMLGCMTELMGRGGPVEAMYGAVAKAAAEWDGTDPVREFAALLS
ncbi:VOC family protein [Mycobacteroides immunogenum]|uniref:VOC family protein n=1 Tax=Mycobacteroides immunogenum TaxID=83262 RepID=UPI0025B790CC|nr:VOC family protein [Mycobacteroides immunogenum]WJR33061.1 VOC family protein [Mycobacteroides immunogenum]